MDWRDVMERAMFEPVLGGGACDLYRKLWDEGLQCVKEGRVVSSSG